MFKSSPFVISVVFVMLLLNNACKKEALTESEITNTPLKPSFVAVYVNGDKVITEDYLLTVVEDGEMNELLNERYIAFINTSEGSDNAIWQIEREEGSIYIDQGDTIFYNFEIPGIYNVSLRISNSTSYTKIVYTNYINALPYPNPIALDSLLVVDEGEDAIDQIKMVFSRSMESPSNDILEALELRVYNDYQTVDITLSSVQHDESYSNVIWLSLSDEIYNTDSVFLSYSSNRGEVLKSIDGKMLPAFSSRNVRFNNSNLFEKIDTEFDWNFEGPVSGDYWTSANWLDTFSGGTWYIAENFSSPDTDGNNSLYVEVEPLQGAAITLANSEEFTDEPLNAVTFNLSEGSYLFYLWIYVLEAGKPAGWEMPNIRMYMNNNVSSSSELLICDINPDFQLGRWHKLSATTLTDQSFYRPDGGENYFVIRVYNSSATDTLKLYIDRVEVINVEVRPSANGCNCD